MNLKGNEKWCGNEPRKASVKQEIIMDIIYEMTGEQIESYNSKTAYEFISRYTSELKNRVLGKFVQDEEEDPYLLYMEIFIDREYVFTIKNICSHEVCADDNLDYVDIEDYEVFVDENHDNDLNDAYSIL